MPSGKTMGNRYANLVLALQWMKFHNLYKTASMFSWFNCQDASWSRKCPLEMPLISRLSACSPHLAVVFFSVSDIIELHNCFSNNCRGDIYKVWEITVAWTWMLLRNTAGAVQSHESWQGWPVSPFRDFCVIFLHPKPWHSHSTQHPSPPAVGSDGLTLLLSRPVVLNCLGGGTWWSRIADSEKVMKALGQRSRQEHFNTCTVEHQSPF